MRTIPCDFCRYYATFRCRKCDWKDDLYADVVGMPHKFLDREEAEKIAAAIEKDLEEK